MKFCITLFSTTDKGDKALDYSDFCKRLKKVVSDFYLDGAILENSVGDYIKSSTPSNRVRVLKKIVKLVMTTSFVDEYTKLYLSNKNYSYQKVTDILNERTGSNLSVNQVKGKIWHNVRKVSNLLGAESLKLIINYRDNDISIYEEIVDRELVKYRKNIQGGILIDIQSQEFRETLSEEEFKEFVSIIKPYTVQGVKESKSKLTKEMLQYMNHLIANSDSLDGNDLKRYNLLLSMVN